MRVFGAPRKAKPAARAKVVASGRNCYSAELSARRAQLREALYGPRLQPRVAADAPDDAYQREAERPGERAAPGKTLSPVASDPIDGRKAALEPHVAAEAGAGVQIPPIQRAEGDGALKHYPKKHVYSYTEGGNTRWIDDFKIDFMSNEGYDLFLLAKKKGYSIFAAMFVVAHASYESGWGQGNWASETHNLFSVMGGSNKKYKGEHGTLQVYGSTEDSFTNYIALIGRVDRWPATVEAGTGLYFKSEFTPDDVNKAFNQYNYWKEGTGYVYNFKPSSDYGEALFERMKYLAGPFIVLSQQRLDNYYRLFPLVVEEYQPQLSQSIASLRAYIVEMKTAYAEVGTKLAEHRALKKSGNIGLKSATTTGTGQKK